MEVLLKFGFKLSPGADSIDEPAHRPSFDSLRQLAACFETPALDQNKEKFLLVKYVRNALLGSGLTVQQGHGHFFTTESPVDSAAGAAENTGSNEGSTAGAAGATGDTRAAMHQQLEALERQISALQGSIGLKPRLAVVSTLGGAGLANPLPGAEVPAPAPTYTSEDITVSGHTTPPAALYAFEVEELTADACEILRQQTPFQSLSALSFPIKALKSGSFLGGVLGRFSGTALLAFPLKAAALEALFLPSHMQNGAFSARVFTVPAHLCRLA